MKKIHHDTIVNEIEDAIRNANSCTENAIVALNLIQAYKELDNLGLIHTQEVTQELNNIEMENERKETEEEKNARQFLNEVPFRLNVNENGDLLGLVHTNLKNYNSNTCRGLKNIIENEIRIKKFEETKVKFGINENNNTFKLGLTNESFEEFKEKIFFKYYVVGTNSEGVLIEVFYEDSMDSDEQINFINNLLTTANRNNPYGNRNILCKTKETDFRLK